MGRGSRGGLGQQESGCVRLIDDDGPFGQQRADDVGRRLNGEFAGRKRRPARRSRRNRCVRGQPIGQFGQRGRRADRTGQRVHGAALGNQVTRFARIAEEGDRGDGPGQDQPSGSRQLRLGRLAEIGDTLGRGDPGTALQPGREGLAEHPGPEGPCQPCRRSEARGTGGVTADQDHRRLPRAQRLLHRDGVTSDLFRLWRNASDRFRAVGPGHVGGQDEGGDPLVVAGGDDRIGGIRGDTGRAHGAADPPRNRAGNRVDIGFQRGVEALVVGGVIADHHQHRDPGASGVVQVRQAVAQTGAQMQQYGGGLPGHPGVAVGGTGCHPFEQGEDTTHLRHRVQGGDEVHLRGSRVGEAHPDTVVDQGGDECLRAVHRTDSS